MGISPNVLAGLAAGLHGGNRAYNDRAAELEQLRIQREQEDRQGRILARSIARDELAELREQQRDERELAGTVAQTYALRPDAMVSAPDVARLQKHGYGGMLGERAAPADMGEFAALSGLVAPGITPQSATAREQFIRPTEQQIAQRTAMQRQNAAFEDAERERAAEAGFRNWLTQNPTASPQARWQQAQTFGVKFGGLSPAEQEQQERQDREHQARLTGMRNQPATTTGRSTEDERLFQRDPWRSFYQQAEQMFRGAIPSLAAGGQSLASINADIQEQARQYADRQYAGWLQGQKDDQARKAAQRGGQAPAAGGTQSGNTPQAAWDDALADQLIGFKPGAKADQKKVVELVQQMADQDEQTILQAVKWARKHGIVVNFGGGQ